MPPYREYLTADQYFMCLVDGIPFDESYERIVERLENYDEWWSEYTWYADYYGEETGWQTFREFLYAKSHKCVPFPDLPDTFGWEFVEPAYYDYD